jgi:hypothetical protein
LPAHMPCSAGSGHLNPALLQGLEKADWGGLWLSRWPAVVGCRGQFATVFRGSGCRNSCRLMLPNSQPTFPPPAHGSCECSRPVSRPVPHVSSVRERFHAKRKVQCEQKNAQCSRHAITQKAFTADNPLWPPYSITVEEGKG